MLWSRSFHPDARRLVNTCALALVLAACDLVLGADFDQSRGEPSIVISGGGTGATVGDGSVGGSGGVFTNGCTVEIADNCPSGPCVQGTCRVAKALGLGAEHSCALLDDASVWCWGSNRFGQLGRADNAGSDEANLAAPVPGLGNIVSLAVGGWFSCAVSGAGEAHCWGVNGHGELGRGTTSAHEWEPEALPLSNVNAVFASKGGEPSTSIGGHACASADNQMYCWGSNEFGELGKNASTAYAALPQRAAELDGAKLLVLGFSDTCRAIDAEVSCRGLHRFGLEADGFHSEFLQLKSGALSLATGNGFAYMASHPESLLSIGENSVGQLCNSSQEPSSAFSTSLLTGPFVEVGDAFACALGPDDVVRCCGSNKGLALGSQTLEHSTVPLVAAEHVLELALGWNHSCVITADDAATSTPGGVLCWGENAFGQLGRASASPESWKLEPVFW